MNPLGEASKSRSDSQDATSAATAGQGGVTVTPATVEGWHRVTEWVNGEGWNVGNSDAVLFHTTDPAGRICTQLVSAISIVTYSDEYPFLGHYLVDPEFRGHGLDLATWRVAFPYTGSRNIGLDAAIPQLFDYQKFGFAPVYRTVRYGGRVERSGTTAAGAVPVTTEHLDAVAGYDQDCFPTDRRAFAVRQRTPSIELALGSKNNRR